jgi:tetratricopeptide (TPR) repeat protein
LPFIFYVAPLLVAGLFYGVYRTLKFSRLIVFGFLFYLINILLILQLLSIGDAIIADRYTYIPYIGLFFILAMGFDKLFFKQDANRKIIRPAMIIGVLMLAVSCVFITRDRIPDWKTDVTIADDLLNKFPDDRLALNNKGFILFEQGNYQEAIDLFTKSIELKPDYLRAYMNLINCYIALNDSDKAMKWTDNALKIAPNDFNVLNTKGYLLTRQLNYTGALKYYKEAMALKKDDLNNYIYLSKCYYLLHDYDNWIKTIDAGLQLDPDNFVLLNNKGYFFYLNRRYGEALGYYKEALSRKPDFETARVNLQACYQALNDSTGKHHE